MLGHVLADRLDRPSNVRPWNTVLRPSQPRHEAHEPGHTGHEHPIPDVD